MREGGYEISVMSFQRSDDRSGPRNSRLTLGESSRDTVSNGQTGGSATDDDKVIIVAELGHLPPGEVLSAAGEGLDDTEEARSDGEGLDETHLPFFEVVIKVRRGNTKCGKRKTNVGGVCRERIPDERRTSWVRVSIGGEGSSPLVCLICASPDREGHRHVETACYPRARTDCGGDRRGEEGG